jgi:hypothetical protein
MGHGYVAKCVPKADCMFIKVSNESSLVSNLCENY